MLQGINSDSRDRPCLQSSIIASNFEVMLVFQDKLLESVWKLWIPVKEGLKELLDPSFPELIQKQFRRGQ